MRKLVLLMVLMMSSFNAVSAERPRKLLFVDTGNTGRSVTAEALANADIAKGKLNIRTISRAVDKNPFEIHPEANVVTLLQQRGINVAGHLAAQIDAQDVRHADLILTMTAKHKAKVLELFPQAQGKVFTLSEYATGTDTEVPDAFGKPMDVYVAMVKQVDTYVAQALKKASTP